MNARSRRGRLLTGLTLSCLSGLSLAQTSTVDDLDSTAYSYPVVIAPTRLKQSLAEVPASVTVITGETIRRYGITNIPDALRLVPGMAVTRSRGSDYRITYHGTGIITPRRMNVLIDGFSIYGSALSSVDWGVLPVAIDDIDRIEVTRGPDSAAYGPNSMMSVINILTRRPKDVETAMVSAGAGSHGTGELQVRGATRLGESTQVALTAQTERSSGYDVSTLPGGEHDGIRVRRLNLRSQSDIDAWSTLELQANHVESNRQDANTGDPAALSYADLNRTDDQFSGKWTRALSASHELQVKAMAQNASIRQDWASCWPRILLHPVIAQVIGAHPELAGAIGHGANVVGLLATALTPSETALVLAAIAELGGPAAAMQTSCGRSNLNYEDFRAQLELQDTVVVSDTLRFVAGAGLRQQQAYSEVHLGGKVHNTVRWLFAHGEYRVTPTTTFNVGGYAESNSLGNHSFSPRVATNYRLSDEQTLRAVYSRGTRTPDLLEKRGHWTPALNDFSPPVAGATSAAPVTVFLGNPDLQEEHITSVELGYLLAVRRWGLVLDTRVFNDRLSTLISNYSTLTQLQPNNNASVRLAGAETQANWDLNSDWSAWLNYSYLVNYQASNVVERSQWSRHSGSLGLSHALSDRWRVSVASYQSSGDGQGESAYSRTDLTLTHQFQLSPQQASVALSLSWLDTPEVSTYTSAVGSFQSSFNDRLGVYAKVRLAF
jgi:iron complex outermembrane receptor protein